MSPVSADAQRSGLRTPAADADGSTNARISNA